MATLSPNLQSVLDNRLRYLPPLVSEAINSLDWSQKIIEIGHNYGLHIDEMEEFQGVVLKSMLGIIAPDQFENELINALALSPTSTEKIITDINNKIFQPIHDFVINQGKAPDPLKQSGIVLQNNEEIPSPLPIKDTIPEEVVPVVTSEEPHPLHIKFNDYFINTSEKTDHSLESKE